MKKFIVTALCAIVALCSIPFAACSSESSGLINLADCEIGYELPVYPDCEFDYKVDDDCVVHISEIKAVLTAKNEINEGDLVEGKYYRYEIEITISSQLVGEYETYIGEKRYAGIINGIQGSVIGVADGEIQIDGAITYLGTIKTNSSAFPEITFLYF